MGAAQQLRGGVREYSHESARHHHGHQHLDHRDRALGNECVLPRQRSQETASINDRTLTAHLVFRAALDCYQHAGLDESPSDLLDIVVVWVSAASLGTWTRDLNPLLHRRLEATFFPLGPGPICEADLSKLTRQRLSALLVELEAELAQYSELRHLGHHLLDHADEEAQRLGCIWLTHFPDAETMTRVARVALDERRSLAVRDQAAWTLCFRQRQTRHPSLYFSPEAEATADAALRTLLDRGGLEALPQLASGLRHVCAPEILDFLARDVARAKDAIECYATPALARAACSAALELDSGAGTRALSLASHVLGDEIVPELRVAIERAPTLAHRLEAAQCLVSLEPSALPDAERAVHQGNPFPEISLRLVRYHAQHPREFPTVRGLAVARRTATLSPDVVNEQCRRAAEPLLRYASLAYAADHGHVEFLAYLVHAAGDSALLLRLYDQFAELFGAERRLLPAPFAALGGAGRFSELERLARSRGEFAEAGWELARHARPFRALALLGSLPAPTPSATAARALALFTAGRPDLAARLHPAPHELLTQMVPSAPGAEPDRVNLNLLFSESEASATH